MGAALAKDAGGKSVSFPVDVVAAIANVAYVMKVSGYKFFYSFIIIFIYSEENRVSSKNGR